MGGRCRVFAQGGLSKPLSSRLRARRLRGQCQLNECAAAHPVLEMSQTASASSNIFCRTPFAGPRSGFFCWSKMILSLNSPMRSGRTLFIAKSVFANKSRVPILSGQAIHNWRFPSMISRSPFGKEGPTPSIPAHLTASRSSSRNGLETT